VLLRVPGSSGGLKLSSFVDRDGSKRPVIEVGATALHERDLARVRMAQRGKMLNQEER